MNSEDLKIENPYYKLKYLFGLIGANSLIVQVVLFRELLVTFSGNELAWGIFFATWLLSVGIGSFFYTTLIKNSHNTGRNAFKTPLYTLLIIQSVLLFSEIIIIRVIKTKLGFQPSEILPIEQIFLITSVFIFLPSFIFGALFTITVDLTTNVLKDDQYKIAGMVYSFESFGSFIAGILFNFYLVTSLTSIEISIALFFLNLIYGYFLINKDFLYSSKPFYIIPRAALFKIIGLVVIFALVLTVLLKFDVIKNISDYSYKLQWEGFNFIKQVESKYGKITITEQNGQFNFYQNNNLSFILPDTAGAEQRVHLTMTFHKNPKSVLVFGGMSDEVKELYKYPSLEKVTYVELDPLLVETANNYVSYDDSLYFKDNIIQTVFEDARKFINMDKYKYDVIILNHQEPNTLFSNRYFTVEFYSEVSKKLNPGGIFSFSIASSPNYISGSMYLMQTSIYQTVATAFKNIKVISSDSLTLIASNNLTEVDDVTLFDRFLSRNLENSYFNEYLFLDLISNKRNEERESLLKNEKTEIVNTDFYPKTYLLNTLLYGEETNSTVTKIFNWFSLKENKELITYVFIVMLAASFLYFCIKGRSPKAIFKKKLPSPSFLKGGLLSTCLEEHLIIFTSGIVSISIEILMMLLSQIFFGYVYYKIGLLIAIFMFGLFAGSYLGNIYFVKVKQNKLIAILLATEVIYLLYLVITYIFISKTYTNILLRHDMIVFILLFLVSFLTGAQFPLANLSITGTKNHVDIKEEGVFDNSLYSKTAGRLYAFDLFGACIGSILLTFFIIPYFGVYKAFLFLVIIKGYSLLLGVVRKVISGKWSVVRNTDH